MTVKPPHTAFRDVSSRVDDTTPAGLVAFPLVLVGLLLAVAYPLAAATLLAGSVLALKTLQVGLAAVVHRAGNRIRKLTIPGVGTVEYRLTPR